MALVYTAEVFGLEPFRNDVRQLHMRNSLPRKVVVSGLIVACQSLLCIAVGACHSAASVIPTTSEAAIALAHPTRLGILSWNIWMMPWFTFQSPRNHRRAAGIASELATLDYDILCLEKAFDGGSRHIIADDLRTLYPYRYGPVNSRCCFKISSGVWVLSRLRLSREREIQFRNCAAIECFSRKGAILLSGAIQGWTFQVVATHLQGEEGPAFTAKHQAVRDLQMKQIRDELLDPYAKPGVPQFICGDLGTPRWDPADSAQETSAYRGMLSTLSARNGPDYRITLDDDREHNDLAQDNTHRTAELDYILLGPNTADLGAEWARLVLRHPGWDGPEHEDLSYRYAVGAMIDLPINSPASHASR